MTTPMSVFAKLAPLGYESSIAEACTHYLGGPPCSETALWELCCACMAATMGSKAESFSDAERHVCLDLMSWALARQTCGA